jgi:hypothetical protein
MSGSVTEGSAGVQSELWGARPREWCVMAQMRPLYEAVIDRMDVGSGMELLDAGCGAWRPHPAGQGRLRRTRRHLSLRRADRRRLLAAWLSPRRAWYGAVDGHP